MAAFQRIDEIFQTCCELDPEARAAYLEEECQGDAELRAKVEAMLAFDRRHPAFLEGTVAQSLLAGSEPPRRIGKFRIKRLLGQGGMGAVYEAEQEGPHRTVALKVLRAASFSPEALRRFELEGEVLGRLQHPGIAQVYESGRAETETGNWQPYFAMELVRGEPLGVWARNERLDSRGRLELVARVCDAVQHAHQHGVIHRDLKPQNILVERSGQPRILDFGVARASDSDVQLTTVHTHVGQILGTLAYMSPEQALGDPRAIDTRSDVYSLGVILYELLAGAPPYDVSDMSLPEALRTIQEVEPRRISKTRGKHHGDLETIVDKALEKGKDRRYASAAALADDIRRFLRDEPIDARRPSRMYTLKKFVRRNRTLVASALAILVSLLVGLVAAVLFALGEAEQRRIAEAERREAEEQLYRANLAVALQALQEGNDASARALLDAAPGHLRSWEWHHLRRRLEPSLARTSVPGLRAAAFVDEEHVLAVDGSAVAWLWDTLTGDTTVVGTPGATGRTPLALTPDGGQLLCFSEGELRVSDLLGDGMEIVIPFPYGRPKDSERASALAPDGSRFAVTTIDDRVYCGDVGTGAAPALLSPTEATDSGGPAGADVRTVTFSATGRHVGLACRGGVQLFDVDRRQRIWEAADARWFRALAFDPDGTVLVTGGEHGIGFLEAASQRQFRRWSRLNHPVEDHGWYYDLGLSPDGSLLALAYEDGAIRILDAESGVPIGTLEHGGGRRARVVFGPSGTRLLSYGTEDGALRLWHVRDGGAGEVLKGHEGIVYPVTFSPDGQTLASGSWDATVRLWDPATGEEIATLPTPPKVKSLAFSPDGSRLACGHVGGIRIWDRDTGGLLIERSTGNVRALAYAPDGEILAVGSSSTETLRLYDAHDLEQVLETDTGSSVTALAYSPDGHLLATGTASAALALRDARSGELQSEIEGEPGGNRDYRGVLALAFSPSGDRVVVGWGNSAVTLHEVPSLRELRTMREHLNEVFTVAFSPDGTRIATGGRDGFLRLWDGTGRPLLKLAGHRDYVYSLAFSTDGRWIATGSGDRTIRIWDSQPLSVRWAARRRTRSLRPTAERLVAELMNRFESPEAVARHLRDEPLDCELRRVALLTLLRQAVHGPPTSSTASTSIPVELFTDRGAFESATGALVLSLPAARTYEDYDAACDRGSPRSGIITIPCDGDPLVEVYAPNGTVTTVGPDYCADSSNILPHPSDDTIMANGEDDLLLVFRSPARAVGLDLLTNNLASELLTITFTDSTTQVLRDEVLQTAPNAFEFVGLESTKPIHSIFLDSTGGAIQNEGLAGIYFAEAAGDSD